MHMLHPQLLTCMESSHRALSIGVDFCAGDQFFLKETDYLFSTR